MGNNSVPKFIFRLSRFSVYRGSVLGRFYCIYKLTFPPYATYNLLSHMSLFITDLKLKLTWHRREFLKFKEHKKLKCIYWKLQGHFTHSTFLIVNTNGTAQSSERRHTHTHTHKLQTITTGSAVCYQRRHSNKATFWSLTFPFIIGKTAVERKRKLLP